MIEGDEGEDADAVVLALLLLHLALLGGICWLVGTEFVVDDLIVLVDTALHLGLVAAGEEGQGSGGEKRGGDLGGAAHGLGHQRIRDVGGTIFPLPWSDAAKYSTDAARAGTAICDAEPDRRALALGKPFYTALGHSDYSETMAERMADVTFATPSEFGATYAAEHEWAQRLARQRRRLRGRWSHCGRWSH